MPTVYEDASAVLLLADFANADPSGKVNMVGAGFILAGWDPNARTTAPMHLAVMIDVHGRHAGQQMTFELELRDLDLDQVVALPTPLGSEEAVRVAQNAKLEKISIPGVVLPEEFPCRVQMTLAFPTGLPLTPGHGYAWRLKIDGQRRRHWEARFYVPEMPQGPVFGGPVGPADIPGVVRPNEVVDDD